MVEKFIPTRRAVYGDDLSSMRPMSFEDVAALVDADTTSKRRRYAERNGELFLTGVYGQSDEYLVDIEAARGLLVLAMEAKRAAESDEPVSFTDMGRFEVTATEPSERARKLVEAADRLDDEGAELAKGLGEAALEQFLGGRRFQRGGKGRDLIGGVFCLDIPRGDYAAYLYQMVLLESLACRMMDVAEPWSATWFQVDESGESHDAEASEADGLCIMCALGFYENNESGARKCLSTLVDRLFTLHLNDVKTVSFDGGQEARIITTGISALWWCALDSMRDGRLGICEVCGKPYVARGERGKPRKYCSEACRQWNKNHPGQKKPGAQ